MAIADYFLKIDGIDGESQDGKHKGEIDVISYNWGATQTGSSFQGGGMGSGKVQMNDFTFVMQINKATPKLMLACASGEHIKTAVLTCRKAGKEQQEFLKVTMTDLLVSSYQTGAASNGDTIPTEQISLNYSTIKFDYKAQKADGTLDGAITAGWDLKQNQKL